MVHDEYFMNIETGEILTGTQAIQQYYGIEKHGCLDAWTDEWKPTGEQASNLLDVPNFAQVINC